MKERKEKNVKYSIYTGPKCLNKFVFSLAGSEAGPLSDGDDSASPGVIIGIVVSLLVVGFLLFAVVWICYKR